MKILVIHHVEPMWDSSIPHNYRDYLLNYLIENSEKYDVIMATFLEDYQSTTGCEEIDSFITKTNEWGYGWGYGNETKPKQVAKYHEFPKGDIIRVSSPHDWAYLYDWIKELKGHEIDVCGGYRTECLLDLEESLEHLEIPFKTLDNLVYG